MYFHYNSKDLFSSINTQKVKYSSILVFTGGLCAKPQDACTFFEGKNFDCVIAADSGLESLDEYNEFFNQADFTPDYILGDMDSIQDKNLLAKYKSAVNLNFPCDKDFTDTELALVLAHKILAEGGRITLAGGDGGRTDHLLAVWDLFSTSISPDFWITSVQILAKLTKGQKVNILPAKETDPVSVIRPDRFNSKYKNRAKFRDIKSTGLVWESDLFRKSGCISLSNRVKPEFIENRKGAEISVKNGVFVICTMLDTQLKFL
ncbi:MAG: hypothetical protein MJ169_00100 [Treponema sp.]|nr:hypothetical protein [Treponema sp.]